MRVARADRMFAWALLLPAVTISEIQIADDGRLLTDTEIETFIDSARCTCDAHLEVRFDVASTEDEGSLVLARGKRCVDSEGRLSDSCEILHRANLSGLRQVELEIAVSQIADCSGERSTDALVVLADETDEDLWKELATRELPGDTEAPPSPENTTSVGGEELAEVVFERPDSKEELRYQVLCEREGAPVLSDPPAPGFVSAYDLCGAGSELVSEKYVCAEVSTGSDSVTVLGLENGQTYHFYVVAIDVSGNASAPADAGEVTPSPELDLWELYQQNGGQADGGHCFVATAAFGDYDHPQVVLLRRFRDRVLERSELGRALIAFYYRHSPALARWIARSDARRKTAQLLLWPIAAIAGGVTP